MANGKKSFVLYCDMMHTVDLLDDALAGKLLKHLLRYVNDDNPETDDILLKVAFEPIKRQLKRDLQDWEDKRKKRSEAGKEGGVKSGEIRRYKKYKAKRSNASKLKQTEANEAVNVNGTVNVNVNVKKGSIPSEMWDSIKNRWLGDFRYKEKICRDKNAVMPAVELKMQEFISEIELKEDYKNIPGLKIHFINWYNKKLNGNGKSTLAGVGKTIELDRP